MRDATESVRTHSSRNKGKMLQAHIEACRESIETHKRDIKLLSEWLTVDDSANHKTIDDIDLCYLLSQGAELVIRQKEESIKVLTQSIKDCGGEV